MSDQLAGTGESDKEKAIPRALLEELSISKDEETSGSTYKVAETALKGVSNLLAADAEDESLRRYKESLLGTAAHGDLGDISDPRRVVVDEFRIAFDTAEKHADIVFNLRSNDDIAALKKNGVTLKEGCKYKFIISFSVQHDIVAGMKFVNCVKKSLISATEELMIGSYPPSSTPHKFEFPKHGYMDAPKGMLYRGKYSSKNEFIDSDGVKHLEFDYELQIKKDW
eukprot:gene2104-4109_t